MGVVEVDRRLLRQAPDILEILDVPANDVLDGGAGEEIFLAQAQFLSRGRGVGRIKHAHQPFGARFALQRAKVIACIERIEADGIERQRIPQPQGVDAACPRQPTTGVSIASARTTSAGIQRTWPASLPITSPPKPTR